MKKKLKLKGRACIKVAVGGSKRVKKSIWFIDNCLKVCKYFLFKGNKKKLEKSSMEA